eukprot:COSAG02_NODE_28695_length_584_cov_1.144330_1_plen_151_part_10
MFRDLEGPGPEPLAQQRRLQAAWMMEQAKQENPLLVHVMDIPEVRDAILGVLPVAAQSRMRRVCVDMNKWVKALLLRSTPVAIGGLVVLDYEHGMGPHDTISVSKEVHALSIAEMKWVQLPNMLTGRVCHATCRLPDGSIFVAGGITEDGL